MNRKIKNKAIYEEEDSPMEKRIEWLAKIWKIIGMPGTPTEDDILNKTNIEEETIRAMRWANKLEKEKDTKNC